MDARTEEIRARVAFYPPGSNCDYCYGSEHYAEDVPYLLTELTALREEVERLKMALGEILWRFPAPTVIDDLMADVGYGHRAYELKPVPRDSDIVRWRAVLSPSPAQDEEQ